MNEELMVNEDEMIEFITGKLECVSKEVITAVLDLEFEFLKLKGVVEE